ncbi:MAG: hypothetical protein HN712_22025 [Gemmatimonadetes bacterium]|jgi:hypothetical protein|nr:hypothetical protein [Gemmatimonadota bacterium]MBT7863007.1 hypothetical protein [Gemmatimonadota bacterium]
MIEIPKVRLGNSDIEVTRLISGGNPLCGNSHFSPDMNDDMRDYFSEKQVVVYLHQLEASGINTLQARGDFHRILYWRELFKREGGHLHFIAQTASEMADVFENIRVIAATGAEGIYHHGSRTDNLWLDGRIDEVEDYLKCMRDTGVQVGLASHIPEVFDYVEEKGWDVDFYMTCFYNLNKSHRESALVDPFNAGTVEVFDLEDPPRMIRIIQQTQKMCLAFKFLAAGRRCRTHEDVRTAFEYVFANIKTGDAVIAGMFPKHEDQIQLNVQHTVAAIESARASATSD